MRWPWQGPTLEEVERYGAKWVRENITSTRRYGLVSVGDLPASFLLGCSYCGALIIPTKEFQEHHTKWHREMEH